MKEEFELLRKYIQYRVKYLKPMTLKDQFDIWRNSGYWEYGRTKDQLASFEQFKLLKINL